MRFYILIWHTLIFVEDHVAAEGKELRILGFLPMSGGGWPGGAACLPAIHMAVDDVNSRDDILNGYTIHYKHFDTKCESSTAVFRMAKALEHDPPYVMLSGCICSTAAAAMADISHRYNLTQVSPGAGATVLSDRKKFPTFFRLMLPSEKLLSTRIDILKAFNWKKAATIYKAIEALSVFMDTLVREMDINNISIVSQEVFVNDLAPQVADLKKSDARIIFPGMYEDDLRKFLCEAYKVGLYGRKIVWIVSFSYRDNFWKQRLDELDCTEEQMGQAIEGMFVVITPFRSPFQEDLGIANITGDDFDKRFYNHPLYDQKHKSYDYLAPKCYDHIWIMALALNCTDNFLRNTENNKTLDEFTYSDSDINAVIMECMKNVSYKGVSGQYTFFDGEPEQVTTVSRVQGGKLVTLAYHNSMEGTDPFHWIPGALKWEGGYIPRDSTVITYKEMVIPDSVYIPMCGMAAFGIALTSSLFVFNVVLRNNKTIKLSSPNINNILLLGCLLCYLTVFVKTSGVEKGTLCRIRVVLFCLGFTITFGALFSKTWRVYKIFTNKKLRRMKIRDARLFAIIAGLFAVVSILLIIWEIIGPYTVVTSFLHKQVTQVGLDEEIRPFIRMCVSSKNQYFNWIIYIGEGVLLAFGSFLAWETRHVKIEALNDSHQIGVCLYNVVILSAVGLTLSLLLDEQVVMLYGVTSGCLIIGTTVTLCVVFVPKIHAVYRKTEDFPTPFESKDTKEHAATTSNSGRFLTATSLNVPENV